MIIDKLFELEDASTTIEEVTTHVAAASLDSVLCQNFLDLPLPKESLASTGFKSIRMEQMLLLVKMDVHKLMKKPENKYDYHVHECEYCEMLINLPWKLKGSYKNKGG